MYLLLVFRNERTCPSWNSELEPRRLWNPRTRSPTPDLLFDKTWNREPHPWSRCKLEFLPQSYRRWRHRCKFQSMAFSYSQGIYRHVGRSNFACNKSGYNLVFSQRMCKRNQFGNQGEASPPKFWSLVYQWESRWLGTYFHLHKASLEEGLIHHRIATLTFTWP